jgi:hypothetical protein
MDVLQAQTLGLEAWERDMHGAESAQLHLNKCSECITTPVSG